MKLRILYSAAIFVGSYLPLALILLVQGLDFAILKNGLCREFGALRKPCERLNRMEQSDSGHWVG